MRKEDDGEETRGKKRENYDGIMTINVVVSQQPERRLTALINHLSEYMNEYVDKSWPDLSEPDLGRKNKFLATSRPVGELIFDIWSEDLCNFTYLTY